MKITILDTIPGEEDEIIIKCQNLSEDIQNLLQKLKQGHTKIAAIFSTSSAESGTGLDAGPTKPVQPRVLRTTYQVSSFMTILTRT